MGNTTFSPVMHDLSSFLDYLDDHKPSLVLANMRPRMSGLDTPYRVVAYDADGAPVATWDAVHDQILHMPGNSIPEFAAEHVAERVIEVPGKPDADMASFRQMVEDFGWEWVGGKDFLLAVRQERRLPVVALAALPVFLHGGPYQVALVVERKDGRVTMRPWRLGEVVDRAFDDACAEIVRRTGVACHFGTIES